VRIATPVPPQWGSGSDPAARPWQGSAPRGDGSQPFAQPLPDNKPTTTMAGLTVSTAKKSRWPLVLLVLLFAIGAVAGGVYVAQRESVPVAKQTPSDDKGTTGQLEERAPPPTETKSPVAEPTPTAPPVVEATPPTAAVETTPEVKKPKVKVTKKPDAKTPKPRTGAAAPTEIQKEPAAKPCNPFDAMHGCPPK
jgi:hypothetical protein